MSIPTYTATIHHTTLNKLVYGTAPIDPQYKSTYNTPLVQFNQKYLIDKLIYKLCELNIPCCLYNGTIHCIIYNTDTSNSETIQNSLQQYIDTQSNNHNTKWRNVVQFSDDSDIPDTILQQCVQTYIEYMLHKQFNMFKHSENVYVQLDVTATQQYTTNAVNLSVSVQLERLSTNSYKSFNILLEAQQYKIKPLTQNTMRQGTLYEDTDEPVSVYVLPKCTNMYIVHNNNNRIRNINNTDMSEYWLYKYRIQLPAQYNTVNVQYRYDSAALQYPKPCVLDAAMTKIQSTKTQTTVSEFGQHIIDAFNTIELRDFSSKQNIKLFYNVKAVQSNDVTATGAKKQKLFASAAAV